MVLVKVKGTYCIRVHEVPFLGVLVGNAQLRSLAIYGVAITWDRQASRWCLDLRDNIGQGGSKFLTKAYTGFYWKKDCFPLIGTLSGLVFMRLCFVLAGLIGKT